MSITFYQLLELDDKGVSLASDANAREFRQALLDNKVDRRKAEELMAGYLSTVDDASRFAMRGNLLKSFAADTMTGGMYLKGMEFVVPGFTHAMFESRAAARIRMNKLHPVNE